MPTWVGRLGRSDGVSWGSEIAQDTWVLVGHAIATVFRVWGRNLPRFLLLTLVCYLPIIGWYALHQIDAFQTWANEHLYRRVYELHPALHPSEVIGLGWIALAIGGAAIAICTIAELRGARTSIWRALWLALRHVFALAVIALAVRLATYGVAAAIQIARWDPMLPPYRSTSEIWMAVFAVLWIVTSSVFLAAAPAAIAERRGPLSAIARNFAVLRGAWPKVLAIGTLHYALAFGIYYGVSSLMMPWIMSDFTDDTRWRLIVYGQVRMIIELVLFSLASVIAAVIYERARAAKEGPAPDQLDRVFE